MRQLPVSCIHVDNLHKHYGGVKAVDGVSFGVDYGKVFGFLGPNGAGKTTTIKILTTLIQQTAGKASVLGHDLPRHASAVRQRIGLVQQKPSFESNLTVEAALDLYGKLWNVDDVERRERVEHLLKVFGLDEVRNVKNEELSIGQRRRLQVAREFMHDMDLLFLDEPTVGLDPAARRTLLDYIKERVRDGLTVFFTTHIMEEAEYLCDEVAIINKGKIIALDTPANLKQKFAGMKTVEIRLKEPVGNIEHALREFRDMNVDVSDSTIRISSSNAEQTLLGIIQSLGRNQIQIASILVNPPTLEEIFLTMVSDSNGSGT